eukprot:TRINITY_DN1574_c0_g1_i1.p1 TRINITY_DN1574_c0_g1~~TRINITY_DN1574_c0_g1_i1.p1  ORF type:complete len:402 (+),score=81.90 TRINITY_DN1574_c0_g1_i1:361-1566(+)
MSFLLQPAQPLLLILSSHQTSPPAVVLPLSSQQGSLNTSFMQDTLSTQRQLQEHQKQSLQLQHQQMQQEQQKALQLQQQDLLEQHKQLILQQEQQKRYLQHQQYQQEQQRQLLSQPKYSSNGTTMPNTNVELPKRVNSADTVQGLLESYPNPQTENKKLLGLIETLIRKFDDHSVKVERSLHQLDQRLTSLESSTKDFNHNRHGHSNRSNGHLDSRKKQKKRSSSAFYEGKDPKNSSGASGVQLQSDEELARQLQAQFNQEESAGTLVSHTQTLSDEEYAQKLQAAYLRREYAAARRKSKSVDKKQEKKDKKEEESKPTLWSRLFGVKSEDESDNEDFNLQEKKKPKASGKKKEKKAESPSTPTSATLPFPYYYPQSFMPNMPGGVQYMPMNQPGQYYLTN